MKEIIACCGLDCSICPVYIAAKENSDIKRKDVAAAWSKMYMVELSIEDINCDGCRSENGKLFGHCRKCFVRNCAVENEVDCCAYCHDYSCRKLDSFLITFPNNDARNKLESIRGRCKT